MRRLVALLLLTCLQVQVLAQPAEPPPCLVIESDMIDLEPKTELEKIYFGALVCVTKQRNDALALVRSSTTSLAAREPEALRAVVAQQVARTEPEDDTLLVVLLSGAIGAILGGGAVLLLR